MVSSTYYDLREIRQQLSSFIGVELGYRALISESGTFPIDPDADTIENCRRRVEANADVLILVIGERYESLDQDSRKSVTNLEYLAARAKGIPVYAFVDKRVLAVFEVWRVMTTEKRSAVGDSVGDVRLFTFVESVRTADSVWMNGFDNASDLVGILRVQLAYLTHEALELQRLLGRDPERQLLRSLGPRAFRLALERPGNWEYRLFAQALDDEVSALESERREYDLGFAYGANVAVDALAFPGWLTARVAELQRIFGQVSQLIQVTLQEALGPPGVSGNVREIVFVARQLGRLYREAFDWNSQVRCVHTDAAWTPVVGMLASLTEPLVRDLGLWGRNTTEGIEQALRELRSGSPPEQQRKVVFTFHLEIPDTEPITAAMNEALRRLGVA